MLGILICGHGRFGEGLIEASEPPRIDTVQIVFFKQFSFKITEAVFSDRFSGLFCQA